MEKRKEIQDFFADFLKCGVAGWCMEIIFTSIESIAAGDMKLMGKTSLHMFPIYGLGVLLGPISHAVDVWIGDTETLQIRDKIWRHGMNDMVLIFTAEYLTGYLLKSRGMCPWDYSGRRYSIDGLIRLDFAPCWFAAGLIFEHITRKNKNNPNQQKEKTGIYSCKPHDGFI